MSARRPSWARRAIETQIAELAVYVAEHVLAGKRQSPEQDQAAADAAIERLYQNPAA